MVECTECKKDATHLVNDIAPVCGYHAKGAHDEGFITKEFNEYTQEELDTIWRQWHYGMPVPKVNGIESH